MNILHLGSGNRWTGAVAPAFAEVEALHDAGISAHFAYVGGYRLEWKIGQRPFAHPIIRRGQDPVSFIRTVAELRRFITNHSIDVVHAHLSYDHWITRFLSRSAVRTVRTFHSRRAMRNDPFTRLLVRRTDAICIVNETFSQAPLLQNRPASFTPPPLDLKQFHPSSENVRSTYGLSEQNPVVGMIGKLAPGRGFEEGLETFSLIRQTVKDAKMLIVGHGEHRTALESLCRKLAISDDVMWAGYHEDDLAAHYRSMDVMLFTAAGSDEGHRAVLESLGCGVPASCYPIPGTEALLGPLSARLISDQRSPRSLSAKVLALLASGHSSRLSTDCASRASHFSYDRTAQRLTTLYARLLDQRA